MIRVLQVVGTMDMGGAETLIMNLYRNIDREQVQFDFLCHNRIESKYSSEIQSLGGRMFMVPGISHCGILRYQQNLYRFFKEHPEYHVIHSHHNELSGIILKQAKKAGVPCRCAHAHIVFTPKNLLRNFEWQFFKRYFTGNVTDAFACSYAAGRTLFTGDLLNNFQFLPNVTDVEKLRFTRQKREKIRQELAIGEDEIVYGHVGRFAAQKNHLFAVEIFNELLKREPNAKLVLIGEGALKTAVAERCASLGIEDHVMLLGSRSDVPDCLCAMDLFLFPSLYEGLSVACVEAQAAGLPILTSTSVSSEIVLTALVKQYDLSNSAALWAEQALNLIQQHNQDNRADYAAEIRTAGFDVHSVAKQMEQFYLSADKRTQKEMK